MVGEAKHVREELDALEKKGRPLFAFFKIEWRDPCVYLECLDVEDPKTVLMGN